MHRQAASEGRSSSSALELPFHPRPLVPEWPLFMHCPWCPPERAQDDKLETSSLSVTTRDLAQLPCWGATDLSCHWPACCCFTWLTQKLASEGIDPQCLVQLSHMHGVPRHLQCPLFPSILHSIPKNFASTAIGKGKRVQQGETLSNSNAFLSDKPHLLKGWAKGCVLDRGGRRGPCCTGK